MIAALITGPSLQLSLFALSLSRTVITSLSLSLSLSAWGFSLSLSTAWWWQANSSSSSGSCYGRFFFLIWKWPGLDIEKHFFLSLSLCFLPCQHFFLSLRHQIGRKGASIVVEKRKKSRQCWWFICVRLYVVAAIDMAGPLAAAEKEIGGYLLLVSPCKSIWCETHTC